MSMYDSKSIRLYLSETAVCDFHITVCVTDTILFVTHDQNTAILQTEICIYQFNDLDQYVRRTNM